MSWTQEERLIIEDIRGMIREHDKILRNGLGEATRTNARYIRLGFWMVLSSFVFSLATAVTLFVTHEGAIVLWLDTFGKVR